MLGISRIVFVKKCYQDSVIRNFAVFKADTLGQLFGGRTGIIVACP